MFVIFLCSSWDGTDAWVSNGVSRGEEFTLLCCIRAVLSNTCTHLNCTGMLIMSLSLFPLPLSLFLLPSLTRSLPNPSGCGRSPGQGVPPRPLFPSASQVSELNMGESTGRAHKKHFEEAESIY